MIKPHGYDDIQVTFGRKITLPAGGYVCRIKSVEETESKKGAAQIKVQIDIAEGDYRNFWKTKWEEKLEENRKAGYPKGGTVYVSLYKRGIEAEGTNPQFKAFCEAYKSSNDTDINWTAQTWGDQFEGKYIGAVYRLEQNEFNGHKYMQPNVAYWCSVDTIRSGDYNTPADRLLSNEPEYDTFIAAEEDIPF